MIDLEAAYPVIVWNGVSVEFRPDAAYDLRTGERWHAYRFVEVPIECHIVECPYEDWPA